MDIVHERAVGMDISKHDAKVCVRVPGRQQGRFTSTVTTWGSTTNEILQLRAFLEEQQVTTVVMEATSDYWKPFYYLLESSLPVMLVNAKAARNIPGRKTESPTRRGWPSSEPMASYGPPSCRRNPSGNCWI